MGGRQPDLGRKGEDGGAVCVVFGEEGEVKLGHCLEDGAHILSEKMISLYESLSESLYLPWWMSTVVLPDSPAPNSYILTSFFAISLSLLNWLSISLLPRTQERESVVPLNVGMNMRKIKGLI